MASTKLQVALGLLGACLALGAGLTARADVMFEVCPARPPTDGASCADSPSGTVCRYPLRGVLCQCQRVQADGRAQRIWVCGELGE